MRGRAFRSRMNLLALVAISLLALLPTFGRLAQIRQGATADAWTQMCTVAGLKLVKLPAGTTGQSDPPSSAIDRACMDCSYCPLLSTLTAAVVALVLSLLSFASFSVRNPVSFNGFGLSWATMLL